MNSSDYLVWAFNAADSGLVKTLVFFGGTTVLAHSFTRALKEVNISLAEINTTIRDRDFLLVATALMGLYVVKEAGELTRDELRRPLDNDAERDAADADDRSGIHKVPSFYYRLVKIACTVTIVGGVVMVFTWRDQQHHEVALMRLDHENALAMLRKSSTMLVEGVLRDWENAWSKYKVLPSGTSAVVLRNDTETTVTVIGHHVFGPFGGAFNRTDTVVLDPGQIGLVHGNRNSYGFGTGVSLALHREAKPWHWCAHGEVMLISTLEQQLRN